MFNLEDIKRHLGRSIIGISSGTISTIVEAFQTIIEEKLSEGNKVDLGFIRLSLNIKGILKEDEPIDIRNGKNTIHIISKPSNSLINFVKDSVHFEISHVPNQPLQIQTFTNKNTNQLDKIYSGAVCEVLGYKLKMQPIESNGIYFVHNTLLDEYKVTSIILATHRKIQFIVPTKMPVGNYKMILRSSYYGNLKMKEYTNLIECYE